MSSERPVRDDASLVRACRMGDESAWRELIRRYRRLIYSIPVAYRLPHAEADEIFQSVTIKLYENLAKLRKVESLASWLAVTARRECVASLRSGRRFAAIEDSHADGSQQDAHDVTQELHQVECEHMLALAFEQMDEACRALLGALYLEEPTPSYDEIARRLSRPVGSLGPTRGRCLEKLRKIYVHLGGDEP